MVLEAINSKSEEAMGFCYSCVILQFNYYFLSNHSSATFNFMNSKKTHWNFRSVTFLFLNSICFLRFVQSRCSRGCDLALASYYVKPGENLSSISQHMNTDINSIMEYNRDTIPNPESIQSFVRINVPFSCDCINGEFLAHVFNYNIQPPDTYELIAGAWYANLTTAEWIQRFNYYDPNRIPYPDNTALNVTVNCSCGDSSISKAYGLFVTYPLRVGETLDSVSSAMNVRSELIQRYNPNADFSAANVLLYIPGRDVNGNYPSLRSSGTSDFSGLRVGTSAILEGMTVDNSVEFSYEELSKATDEFSVANKIGQGGFGVVYYAELRSQKVAIKKMDMQASREFLAELKVLTNVHHVNLVRLIGYCVEDSLFLVFEYIENGNLSEHLHGIGQDPLPWSTRVQIALDSARGLEYIHEHTVPVYIHRDIKSANILIDKNFHGKVADFGLAKLIEVGNTSLPSRLVGTFGYMPPEYAKSGIISPKVDVYAFGVVLYELISAKEALVKANTSSVKALVASFDEAISQLDPTSDLVDMIDPRLGDNYPLDSVRKMAQLAKACTSENSQQRPNMRSIVVALMMLSSSTEDQNAGSLNFYKNHILLSSMSERYLP
ncbi:hypothetical protein LXL04_017569 [Taraxacum kok-saghyz]